MKTFEYRVNVEFATQIKAETKEDADKILSNNVWCAELGQPFDEEISSDVEKHSNEFMGEIE